MAARAQTRTGASARAGKSSSTKKAAARRAPAPAQRTRATSSTRTTARTTKAAGTRAKTSAPAARPKSSAAKKKLTNVIRFSPRTSLGFPVLPVSIVVALVMLGWFMYPILRLQYSEQRKLDRLQTQLTAVQKRNEKLKAEVERLKTPQGIETAAHELGLARKGEQVWVTVTGTATPAGSTTITPAVARAQVAPAVWTQVLDTVFGVGE